MENTYPKELIDLKLEAIVEKCDDILIVATEARDHARLTNGRVTQLEMINEKKEGEHSMLGYFLVPILAVLLGYLSWMGIQIFSMNKTLSAYEIIITK